MRPLSPNSQLKIDSEATITTAENRTEYSFVTATTEVMSQEKRPDVAPETHEGSPLDSDDGAGDDSGDGQKKDPNFDQFLDIIKADSGEGSNDKHVDVESDGMVSGMGVDSAASPDKAEDSPPPPQTPNSYATAVEAPASPDKAEDSLPSPQTLNSYATAVEAPELIDPSSSNVSSDGATDEGPKGAEPSASGAGEAEGEKTESSSALDKKESLPRRASNPLKGELQNNDLSESVNTVDSWAGKEGSLPPLPGPKPEGPSAAPCENSIDSDLSALSPSPQDGNPGAEDSDGEDGPARYVNFNKLLQPSSSEYYYSQANRSNRQLLTKLDKKVKVKKMSRSVSLDESNHSRVSYLSERSRLSSYRGPEQTLKNGKTIKSAMKKSRGSSAGSKLGESMLSGEFSLPELDEGDSKSGTMKRCAFSCVNIREHERVAGDNPCVTSGVPLSIGWGYYEHPAISLDDYEFNKGPSRDKIEMMVPAGVRRQMLRDEFGVTISEMNASMKDVNLTKRQRRHTVASEHLEGWKEVAESAKRKFKRFVKRTSTAKEEEKLWGLAHETAVKEYLKKNGDSSLGKNPESVGAGRINNGPKVAPENGQAPFLEISFQGERAPSF
mmetsp:Transcript_13120/g.22486  ORF Transcript_13120/g.22486 Transcript_13120/m.22486 type:complete len:611 (-) Transcript_13120:180-2012(-)|eukprot:CAMPEP_0183729560 /NCGR_PEP_ID=MMETSP0737-20130205/30601_1 /TAXON_ID=385413 /ORGANISM="Thalassiosira miniscula, Strain CCMP1093" /LENGTH=610 /DNA_ID=CAMNT_0025961781 /DNA_START=164 /DNA_END=1996 /DNA_ORIENTATION=+